MSEKEPEAQAFEVSKLYIKDASFESPNAPAVFSGDWKPELQVQLNGSSSVISEGVYEVVLTITITTKQDDKTAFLIELQQAGAFSIKGYPDEALQGILGAYCLETLFPYAREAIDSLVIKGGFPPILLSPVNFNALYQQKLDAATSEQEAAH